jgi:hypothetical protein
MRSGTAKKKTRKKAKQDPSEPNNKHDPNTNYKQKLWGFFSKIEINVVLSQETPCYKPSTNESRRTHSHNQTHKAAHKVDY